MLAINGTAKLISTFTGTDVEIDYGEFVQDLILHDRVIIDSQRFLEFSRLANEVGIDTTIKLLTSGDLQIRMSTTSIGIPNSPDPEVFKLLAVYAADRQSTLEKFLHEMTKRIRGKPKEVAKLRRLVEERLLADSQEPYFAALKATVDDFRKGLEYMQQILIPANPSLAVLALRVEDIMSSVEIIDDASVRIRSSNLSKFGLTPESIRNVVQQAVLAAADINYWAAKSKHYKVIETIFPEKKAFISKKFESIVQPKNVGIPQTELLRIVDLAGLPDLGEDLRSGNVKFDQVIKLRESAEIHEFRAWVNAAATKDDEALKAEIDSIRARIGGYFGLTTIGKTLKFAILTGIGLLPGATAIATGLGAVDTFLFDRLKGSTPVAFLYRKIEKISAA